jgi:hypothetical protein
MSDRVNLVLPKFNFAYKSFLRGSYIEVEIIKPSQEPTQSKPSAMLSY